ncbi:hypothetical protein Tco_0772409 [Tanacetum coccineum]|uniref:Retrovirus-related Pol polyprotein from transposon TNT 1-94-like beta-barrel domain-containing protein n=1 Tax=Tanacetum coccineum TaxID=301880 RepID=A0ABQ4ZHT9_9ASTR
MSTLTFADTHNMVAFLDKPAESDGFHKIRYALTVNPTIYTSCIEQFWATTKAKTINGNDLRRTIQDENNGREHMQLLRGDTTDASVHNAKDAQHAKRRLMICKKMVQKLERKKKFKKYRIHKGLRKVVKSKKETEESSKGTEDELESDKSKKAKSSKQKAKGSRKKILGKKRGEKAQQQDIFKETKNGSDKETVEIEEVEWIVEYKPFKQEYGTLSIDRVDGSVPRDNSLLIRLLQVIGTEGRLGDSLEVGQNKARNYQEESFTHKEEMDPMALSDSEEFQEPEFEGYGPKTSKSASEDISNEVRKSNDALLIEKLVLDDKSEKKIIFLLVIYKKEDQGYVDSGCSRHMTWNISYLSDFKEFDGGYVTFGGGAKGGKITGKGTLKNQTRTSNDLKDGSLFDSSLKNASNDELQPSSDAGKKDDEEDQKGNPSIKRSKLDRSYARRASAVQVTTGLDLDWRGKFTVSQPQGLKIQSSLTDFPTQAPRSDSNEKKLIQMIKIHIDQNVADLLLHTAFELEISIFD